MSEEFCYLIKEIKKNAISTNWSCVPTRENFEPKKKRKYPREKKNPIYEMPMRKKLGPEKYLRENILDPRNIHKGTMTLDSSFNTLLLYCISKDFLHEASVLWKKHIYETTDSVDLQPS